MTRLFYQICCLFFFSTSAGFFARLQGEDLASAEPVNVLAALGFLGANEALFVLVPCLSMFFALLGLLVSGRWQKVALCITFVLTPFCVYSLRGRIDHSAHIWMFAGFFLCFLDEQRALHEARNLLVIRFIQSTLLAQYFSAGLWKCMSLFQHSSPGEFLSRGLNYVAYSVAEGTGPPAPVLRLLAWPGLSLAVMVGFAAAVLFQVSCFVPVFTNRFWKAWGLMAVIFHVATGIFLGIWFTPTLLAAMLFLVIAESHPMRAGARKITS